MVRHYEALWDELAVAAARLTDWRQPAAAPPAPGGTADPAALSPSAIFRAYPTTFRSADDRVATVPGVAIDPPYSDVAVLLDGQLLAAIRERCRVPARVGEVVALAPIEARGWFAVMWLLTYGLLRVAAPG